MNQLTKQSSEAEIKAYFCAVLNLSKSDEEFPVNLDEVWPLVYSRKDVAVKKLKNNELFIEGIDYQPLHQNAERSENGQFSGENKVTYMLSVPCLEFFIARKVRPVFEVYRQVFHKVAAKQLPQTFAPTLCDMVATLEPLARYTDMISDRWERIVSLSHENPLLIRQQSEWFDAYTVMRRYISALVYAEAVAKVECPEVISK